MSDTSAFKLVIEDDEGHRDTVPLELGTVSIGRLETNTVRLNERNVSRQHARLVRENGVVFAEDLDSYNGLWLNGDRIQGRHEVRTGDLIRVGDFHLELRGEGLAHRAEETTQRTALPDAEVTKTEIRVPPEPPPSASGMGQVVSIPRDAPPRPAVPAPVRRVEEEGGVHEATAIIRMDAPELRAPRAQASSIAGQKAKLLCVSTKFAGREFEISKTDIVIGRTSENDIAIDHRSVSRHHAKITFNNRRYMLYDLKSANGMMVNGEAYAQTELKRGDLIELGHVKLRFVPPGESYHLTAEEQAAVRAPSSAHDEDEHEERPAARHASRSARHVALPVPVIAIGGLLLVVVVVAVVVVLLRGEPSGGIGDMPTAEVNMMPGEIDTMLGRGHGMLAQRRWEQAAGLATQVLKLDPQNVSAREILVKAQSERQAQAKYDDTQRAVEAGDWEGAWRALQGLPVTSVYAEQSRMLADRVKGAFISDLATRARAALDTQDLEAALARAADIAKIDSARVEVAEIRGDVERLRAKEKRSAPQPAASSSSRATARVATPPTVKSTPVRTSSGPSTASTQKADVQTLYAEAVAQFKAGATEQAIETFNRCIQADPGFGGCYRALGIAYARSGNQSKAAKYYKQYLKVSPDAPDADKVRQLLEQYETAP